MVCYTVLLASAGVFLALVLLHRAAVAPMLGILVVFGASRAFENPAGQSLLPNLGPRDAYPGALAWNASARHIATVGGPAPGGLLFRRGTAAAFAVAGAFFATAVALACVIPPVARAHAPTAVSWASLLAGLAFIRRRPAVFRGDFPGPLCGAAGRHDRPAAGLRPRHRPDRGGGAGCAAQRACRRRARRGHRARGPAASGQGRAQLCSSPSRDSAAPRSSASRAGSDTAKFVDSRSVGRGGVPSFAASTASKRWARGGESRDGGVAPRLVEPCGPDAPAATARFDCRDHPPRRAASPRAGGRRFAALRGRRGGWPPAAAPRCRSGR